MKITACIVLYNNDFEMIKRVVISLLNTNLRLQIFLIDNSPTDKLKELKAFDRIRYYHNPVNSGFGAAHNFAIKEAINIGGEYHFIVNPDIYFEGDVISPMVQFMQNDSGIGMMMPEVLYPDGSMQYLPKLLPNPLWILRRKFIFLLNKSFRFINKYELRYVERRMIYNAPILSGCFTLLNLAAIKDVGGYDENFFMYFEDWDLSRRMNRKYNTLYFPLVSVYHEYEGGANKSLRLFKIWVKSACYYFNKWGWLFDSERKLINRQTLAQFNK